MRSWIKLFPSDLCLQVQVIYLWVGQFFRRKRMIWQKNWTLLISKHRMDGWTVGRQEIMLNLKQYQVRENNAHQKWLRPGRKLIYQPYCQGINWKIFNAREFGLFFKHYQTKLWKWKGKMQHSQTHRNLHSECYRWKTAVICHWKELKSELLQERQVLAMSVQSTIKKLDRHRDLQRLDTILGSEISNSEP